MLKLRSFFFKRNVNFLRFRNFMYIQFFNYFFVKLFFYSNKILLKALYLFKQISLTNKRLKMWKRKKKLRKFTNFSNFGKLKVFFCNFYDFPKIKTNIFTKLLLFYAFNKINLFFFKKSLFLFKKFTRTR